MQVDENTAPYQTTHQGTTYYFCSMECRERFLSQPEQYAGGQKQKAGGSMGRQ
jgi:Cu+-exporting ATPase